MHKRLICILLLALTSLFGAAAFGDEVEMARYIMVLRDRYAPSASPAERERPVAEPDLAQFGGRVITARMSRRLIEIPTSAAEELSKHPDVAYLQRLWTSDPPAAPRLQSQSAPARAATTYSETPDWTTGAYSYDGSGNIRGIGSDLYAYDSAARLISSTVNATTSSYHYDAYGNLTSAGAVNAKNQLTSRTYDTAGHMTTDGADEAYQYDALSMVTGVPSTEGGRRMIYTADEERLAVVTASGSATDETYTIRVRNFRNQVLREFITRTAIGTEWVRDYVYADGRLVAGERQVPVGTSGIRHFHLDHLGSVRLITRGGDAARITEPKYAPFGQEIRSSRDEAKLVYTPLEPLKFTGHERDYTGPENLEDGDYLDYMHARYYDAGAGRFLSVDPAWESADLGKPQSWNRYAYVTNSPVRYTDPDGKVGIEALEIGKAIYATAAEFVTTYVADAPSTSLSADLPKDPVERVKYIEKAAKDSLYKRPSNATTPELRKSVQGKACEVCGVDDGGKRVAGHKKALVEEYYETGTIDKEKMKSLDAVRPECVRCSAREGAAMSRYSRAMKKAVIELFKKVI